MRLLRRSHRHEARSRGSETAVVTRRGRNMLVLAAVDGNADNGKRPAALGSPLKHRPESPKSP